MNSPLRQKVQHDGGDRVMMSRFWGKVGKFLREMRKNSKQNEESFQEKEH